MRTLALRRQHDVEPLGRLGVERGDERRVILQVAIHHYDVISARVRQPGGDGEVLPEVPAQFDPSDALVGLAGRDDTRPGFVVAAVFHQYDLEVGRDGLKGLADLADKVFDDPRGAIDRADHGDVREAAHPCFTAARG